MGRILLVSIALILVTAALPVSQGATLGTYGAILGPDSTGLSGLYQSTIDKGTPKILYQDNGATATVLDST